jgi:hypothetical protein
MFGYDVEKYDDASVEKKWTKFIVDLIFMT